MGLDFLTPDVGLLFWTAVIFLALFFVLKKFVWPLILTVLNEREASIQEALDSIDTVQKDIEKLQAESEQKLAQARAEQKEILRSADETSRKIIGEAKDVAQKEYDKFITDARLVIESERKQAIQEIQDELAKHAIDIAEKILREEMKNKESYDKLIEKTIQEININN
jgi:F-type H+-transporting ATPase subunit b